MARGAALLQGAAYDLRGECRLCGLGRDGLPTNERMGHRRRARGPAGRRATRTMTTAPEARFGASCQRSELRASPADALGGRLVIEPPLPMRLVRSGGQ